MTVAPWLPGRLPVQYDSSKHKMPLTIYPLPYTPYNMPLTIYPLPYIYPLQYAPYHIPPAIYPFPYNLAKCLSHNIPLAKCASHTICPHPRVLGGSDHKLHSPAVSNETLTSLSSLMQQNNVKKSFKLKYIYNFDRSSDTFSLQQNNVKNSFKLKYL